MNFRKINQDKNGIIGGIMATFVATVVILIILLVFILGSGVIKKVTGSDEGVVVVSEEDVGLNNIFGYLSSYYDVMEMKIASWQGEILEVNDGG